MMRPRMPLALAAMITPRSPHAQRIELCPRCCGPLGVPAALALVRGRLVPICAGCTHGHCRRKRQTVVC